MKQRTWELRALAQGSTTWGGRRSLLAPYLGNHRTQLEDILGTASQMSNASSITREIQLNNISAILSPLMSEK
jgi:hypothetical protein